MFPQQDDDTKSIQEMREVKCLSLAHTHSRQTLPKKDGRQDNLCHLHYFSPFYFFSVQINTHKLKTKML